ncbi:MAG: 16S rRNA (adenine(1518)-N(6)/adenine(1519)-N(6))-dimethyltransferase RsmA [Candidatus Nanoarchaeia archaeon]|nr:16S rRNA (adenine(1518)-N(6)/adenine(1519)-N(6))-dimethyltransferase RsmA [Candidatus Nanoarchaeia archaeon]
MGARLGQHFLKSEHLLKQISDYAQISSSDVVLEVGSAFGNLTKYLTAAKKVYAVEIDKKIFPQLVEAMKQHKNVECINMDILKYDFPSDVNKIIGNLPYEISSPITEKILLFLNRQKRANKKNLLTILMYQKEFAERMTAFPWLSDYSRLSVLVNYFAEAEIMMSVPRTAFRPAPKIESAVVKLTPLDVEPNPDLFRLAKILFTHKNKNVIKAIIDSRDMLRLKDKKQLKEILPALIKKFSETKVFYLEIKDMEELLEILKKEKII